MSLVWGDSPVACELSGRVPTARSSVFEAAQGRRVDVEGIAGTNPLSGADIPCKMANGPVLSKT